MPGSGINSNNITDMKAYTGAPEFHTSARILIPSLSEYMNPAIPEDFSRDFTNADEIRRIKNLL